MKLSDEKIETAYRRLLSLKEPIVYLVFKDSSVKIRVTTPRRFEAAKRTSLYLNDDYMVGRYGPEKPSLEEFTNAVQKVKDAVSVAFELPVDKARRIALEHGNNTFSTLTLSARAQVSHSTAKRVVGDLYKNKRIEFVRPGECGANLYRVAS